MAKKAYYIDEENLEVLEYIESTGTQYIDTGIMPDNNTILQLDYSITTTSFTGLSTQLLKAHSSATEPSFNMVCANGGGVLDNARVTFGATYSYYVDFTGLKNNNRHSIEINCPSSKVIVDNTSTYSVEASEFKCDRTLKIFGDTGTFLGRVYSCKIYDNDILVRDFVPCYAFSTGECGLYDKVTKEFFPNKGTGDFLGGESTGEIIENVKIKKPVKVIYTGIDEKINVVEYIESTGTQYIDTGMPANINLKVIADITPLSNAYPFGVAPSQDVQYYGVAFSSINNAVQGYFGTKGTSGNYPKIDSLWVNGQRCKVIANDSKKFYFNDTLIADYSITNNILDFGDMTITICALNGAYLSTRMSMRIHAFKMYDGDTLVRDLVPIRTNEGIYCLYDLVENKYYPNKGTGNFLGGEIIETRLIRSNVAKRATKAYIGVDGIAKQFYNLNTLPKGVEYLFHFDEDAKNSLNPSESFSSYMSITDSLTKFGKVGTNQSNYNASINLSRSTIPDPYGITAGQTMTIEFWCYINTTAGALGILQYGNGGNSYSNFGGIYFAASGKNIGIYGRDGGSSYCTLDSDVRWRWHHVAIVFQNKKAILFVNGKKGTTGANIVANNSGKSLNLSNGNYIDELLISSEALYTEDFTPPTAPY